MGLGGDPESESDSDSGLESTEEHEGHSDRETGEHGVGDGDGLGQGHRQGRRGEGNRAADTGRAKVKVRFASPEERQVGSDPSSPARTRTDTVPRRAPVSASARTPGLPAWRSGRDAVPLTPASSAAASRGRRGLPSVAPSERGIHGGARGVTSEEDGHSPLVPSQLQSRLDREEQEGQEGQGEGGQGAAGTGSGVTSAESDAALALRQATMAVLAELDDSLGLGSSVTGGGESPGPAVAAAAAASAGAAEGKGRGRGSARGAGDVSLASGWTGSVATGIDGVTSGPSAVLALRSLSPGRLRQLAAAVRAA